VIDPGYDGIQYKRGTNSGGCRKGSYQVQPGNAKNHLQESGKNDNFILVARLSYPRGHRDVSIASI
jgi:hypothetical protein